jgi:hypothetical protein
VYIQLAIEHHDDHGPEHGHGHDHDHDHAGAAHA